MLQRLCMACKTAHGCHRLDEPHAATELPRADPASRACQRERADAAEADAEHQCTLRIKANELTARMEGFSARGPARCEAPEEHDAARSSQRAWREELLDAEGKMEGPASEPLLSELPVLGRAQRSGRAETRHGHVHALGRSKNTRSRCGAV